MSGRGARTCGVPRFMCIRSEDEPLPRFYSSFDWWAMLFGRVVNALATTCLTPVAVKLAQRGNYPPASAAGKASQKLVDNFINTTDFGLDDWYNYDDWLAVPHPAALDDHSGLWKSGGIIAAVAVGAMISTTSAFFLLPDTWKDGKLPFVLGTIFPYTGTAIFTFDVLVSRSNIMIVASRVVLSLGYGLQFVIKRQIARVRSSARRGTLMLWNNTFDIVGMASGPALVGLGLRLFVKARGAEAYTTELMVPAVLLFTIVTINLIAIVFSDIDEPYFEDEAAAAPVPNERTPLAVKTPQQQQQQPPPSSSAVAAEVGKPGGSAAAATIEVAAPATSRAKPYWVAAGVQVTCASYTFTRVFLRYSYESAMVVVYSDTYSFSDGDAGMIAGGAAFSALFAVILWRQVQKRYAANLRQASHMVMLVSEICGFLCAIVMILSPSIRLGAGRGWGLAFTLLTAVFFYPSQVLGASIANSYPLDFAIPESTWLNRQSMLAQQELVMPIGNGFGMLMGRVMMGTDKSFFLRNLGLSFLGVMVLQAVIVGMGWDPERTARLWNRCRGRSDTS